MHCIVNPPNRTPRGLIVHLVSGPEGGVLFGGGCLIVHLVSEIPTPKEGTDFPKNGPYFSKNFGKPVRNGIFGMHLPFGDHKFFENGQFL